MASATDRFIDSFVSNLKFFEVASAAKGSLSEVLFPSGYIQIGRPETGDFDAVCFDLNAQSQNREYPIVRISHEEILSNSRIRLLQKLWPSFRKLIEHYGKS
jgi:hypothetical protein